jgi:hypothetical protein
MTSTSKSGRAKLGPFSHTEVKSVLMAIGVGFVLGFAVEMIDAALPKQHKMSAIVDRLFKEREARKKGIHSSYNMGRPDVGFSVTD